MSKMKQRELADVWFKNAARKWAAAKTLFRGKHFVECLFFCHLSLELYLKGLIILCGNEAVPHSHDLVMLARLSGSEYSNEQSLQLAEINEFNLRARYEEHKLKLYKRATRALTKRYLDITEALLLWFKKNTP